MSDASREPIMVDFEDLTQPDRLFGVISELNDRVMRRHSGPSLRATEPERVALALLAPTTQKWRVGISGAFGLDLDRVPPCGLCGGALPPYGFATYAYNGDWRYFHNGCIAEAPAWVASMVCETCLAVSPAPHERACPERSDNVL